MEIVIVRNCLILLGVLVCFSQYSEAENCPMDLKNTVVYEGNSASFPRTNDGQVVRWQFVPSTPKVNVPMDITDSNGNVIAEFNTAYAANQSALIIFNSTVAPQGSMNYSAAGIYFLDYRNCLTAAWLVVIESGPTCSCDGSNPNNVRLTCSVIYERYASQQIHPIMTWVSNSQVVFREEVDASSDISPSLIRSVSLFSTAREDTTYECQLTFGHLTDNQPDYVARNAPNFTASCTVQTCRATTTTASQLPTTAKDQLTTTTTKSIDTGTSPPLSTTAEESTTTGAQPSPSTTIGKSIDTSILTPPSTTTGQSLVSTSPPSSPSTKGESSATDTSPPPSTTAWKSIDTSIVTPPSTTTGQSIVTGASSPSSPSTKDTTDTSPPPSTTAEESTATSIVTPPSTTTGQSIDTSILTPLSTMTGQSLVSTSPPSSPSTKGKSFATDVQSSPSTTIGKSIATVLDVSIDPTFGPVAGGTVVTITATWFYDNVSITAVYIGNNLEADYYNRSGNILLMKTPSINDDQLVNQPLLIILEISNHSSNISTGKYFTYKPNSRIDDVSPRCLITSGGIPLTITGSNLDSVARSVILAVVRIYNGSNITYNSESSVNCEAPTQNGSQMICLSPPFNIREDFYKQLFNGTDQISINQDHDRTRRSLDIPFQKESKIRFNSSRKSRSIKYMSTNEEEELKLYLAMLFDGHDRYKYDILKDSNGYFNLFPPPEIPCEYSQFIHYEEDTITIEGSGFTRCCGKENYKVRIGNETCAVEDLTDSALTFNSPDAKPKHSENDMNNCGGNFAIFIDLGFKTYECSCLSYDDDRTTKLIIIVVATVGSSLILIIFIIVASVVIRRSRKRNRNSYIKTVEYPASEGSREMKIDSQQLAEASPASDEWFYQTDIINDQSTEEEQWNISELRRGPVDFPTLSSIRAMYRNSYNIM